MGEFTVKIRLHHQEGTFLTEKKKRQNKINVTPILMVNLSPFYLHPCPSHTHKGLGMKKGREIV